MTTAVAVALVISMTAAVFADTPATRPATRPMGDDPLGALRDRKRVLVVISPDKADERLSRQREDQRDEADAFADRELAVIEIVDGRSGALSAKAVDAVLRQVGETGRRFAVVLVGKDGGVKLREHDYVPFGRLFDLIDSMPMRQREMRTGN